MKCVQLEQLYVYIYEFSAAAVVSDVRWDRIGSGAEETTLGRAYFLSSVEAMS